MINKRRYCFTITVIAIVFALLSGCGRNANGKDKKAKEDVAKSNRRAKSSLMLPDFTLADLDGKEFRLFDNIGVKPVLLVFWTTNCPVCVKEIPKVNKVFSERQQAIEMVSINIFEPPGMVRLFIRAKGVRYPVLLDQRGTTARAYRIQGVPTYVVVNLEGGMSYYGHDLGQAMMKIDELAG